MILSLKSAEILLIEQNLITRDELEELKKRRIFGSKSCKALKRFKKAVKENYRPFFFQRSPLTKVSQEQQRDFFAAEMIKIFLNKSPKFPWKISALGLSALKKERSIQD